MKFVQSHQDILDTKQSTEYNFDHKGSLVAKDFNKIYAKSVNIDLGNNDIQDQYFIRTYNKMPLDPLGPESRRDIWNRTELKSVSQKTFDNYIMYLRSKNSLYFTKTQRSFINA